MNSARQRAHALLDELPDADAVIVERLLESIATPGPHFTQPELDAAIQAGLDSLAEGRGKDGDAVFDRFEAELDLDELKRGS